MTNRRDRTDLPKDLVIEILLKLPVNSLLRFKCVCKLWYNLIISPNFIAMHRNYKKKVSMLYYHSHNRDDGSPETTTISFRVDSVPEKLKVPLTVGRSEIVGCSAGIVCLSLSSRDFLTWHDKFVLWNPATHHFRQIRYDDPRMYIWLFSTPGFCFDPIADTFKLTRLAFFPFESNEHNSNIMQVSTFRTRESSWKEKTVDCPYQILGRGGSNSIAFSGSVKRCMYLNVENRGSRDKFILCFDMIDELLTRIELPFDAYNASSSTRIAGFKDSLAMFVHGMNGNRLSSSFDVWVMNDGDQSWNKILTCDVPVTSMRAFGFFSKDNVDWIALVSTRRGSATHLLYDPETKKTEEFASKDWEPRFYWYSESLASVN